MLKPDQAKAALEKFKVEDWEDRCLSAAAKLPKGYDVDWVRLLLGSDSKGQKLNNWHAVQQAAAIGIDKLSRKDRLKVFGILFPKLAAHVEAGLQLKHRLPYETSYYRKAFRAPNTPAASRNARGAWLNTLLTELDGYPHDAAWVAAWAPHLGGYGGADAVGVLLAAVVDGGGPDGDAVFDILCASARGEHDTGSMGRHVSRGLLVASRPDGWEFMEKMLLAAQRQEGLRQVILETIDEAHPEAFRRMLRLILEHDLARFSATVRAMNVWFGYQWDSVSVKVVNRVLEQVLKFLEDSDARDKALGDDDAETVYHALWTLGFEDAVAAVKPAAKLLKDKNVERRFVAAHFLGQLDLPAARRELLGALADDDLRVVLRALEDCRKTSYDEDDDEDDKEKSDLFERIERLLPRLPEKRTALEPIVWPWHVLAAHKQSAASELVWCLGNRPPTRLIPHIPLIDTYRRASVVELLGKMKKWDAATRETLLGLVGDSGSYVRQKALEALANCKIKPEESEQLEALLKRKPQDLRRGVLALLLNQKDEAVLVSADRLLASADLPQRLGGLELLRQLAEAKRSADQCRARAETYRNDRPRQSDEERKRVEAILQADRPVPVLENALGLMDPAERTKPVPPRKLKVTFVTPAAIACLESLDQLIHNHRETPINTGTEEQPRQELLGNIENWSFPWPDDDKTPEEDAVRLPLREIWEKWFRDRPRKVRDGDGFELLRSVSLMRDEDDAAKNRKLAKKSAAWKEAIDKLTAAPVLLRYHGIISKLLDWQIRLHPPRGSVEFLLDAVEASFALVPADELARIPDAQDWRDSDWRDSDSIFVLWLQLARRHKRFHEKAWGKEQHVRIWRLLRWRDEPGTQVSRNRADLDELLAAYQAKGATEADLLDQLLGPREQSRYRGDRFGDLSQLTARKPAPELERVPALKGILDRCRARILDIELERGETPTAASAPALDLQSVYGIDTLVRLLHGLGKTPFARGHGYSRNLSKSEVLSHLIEVCYPTDADTPEAFAARMKAEGFEEQRLIELAFHAPQWQRHIEHFLGWQQFTEGVWWFIAHTREPSWGEERETREALIREYTALTLGELCEGAVDVAWFQRVHAALGPKRWQQLHDAVKYASAAQAYKRAQLLSQVMLGKAKKSELVANIRKKRLRDSVRVLGLLPLADGKGRDHDLLDRYHVVQEYHRYARQLGAMTKESALRAVDIGVQNLARTAGYADPIRFEWAMEARAVDDLAKGPITVSAAGVQVSLAIDAEGQPEVTVAKDGKPLKSIPPAAKKHAKVAELTARKTELKKQASRMRLSLETAMCRGDTFTGAELRQLFDHPVLAPRLERLILIGEGIAGYPVHKGQALLDCAGKTEPVKKNEQLRLAHPHDLLATKKWHDWQHDCFGRELVQPFKQVFRELYVLTAAEKKDGDISRRYAGQQINPQQATALWGGRGWVVSPEEGVRRTFHDAGLSAWVTFLAGGGTPADVEGWTIEGVRFSKRGEWKPLPLTKIPPRTFSEVMRDLDLVVSVAHRGGVDPEASASTVEMRASLLRETCSLLTLDNVRIKNSHVLIDGDLSNYSVHLGSGVTHRQPGGHLCLVPVHAQHRGRLFLPFVDDDPKTAEVISKVILLARDREIQDPNILDQIRTVR
jgi:HEAT repeat protein